MIMTERRALECAATILTFFSMIISKKFHVQSIIITGSDTNEKNVFIVKIC